VAAKRAGDDWTMTLAHSNGIRYKKGLPLSDRVMADIERKFRKYRIREASMRVADRFLGEA